MIGTKKKTGYKPAKSLDEDLETTKFPNVQNHLNITRNNKSKYVSVKGVIVNCKKNVITAIIIVTNIYMYLLHECMVMTKFLIDILVTVRILPIEF